MKGFDTQRRKFAVVAEKSPVVPKRRQTTGNGVYPYRMPTPARHPLRISVSVWFTDRAGVLRHGAVALVLVFTDFLEHPVAVVPAFTLGADVLVRLTLGRLQRLNLRPVRPMAVVQIHHGAVFRGPR